MFRLPAIAVQHLPEIPLPVEQSDRDQRKFKIAGRLQMVAGENTEAAGEDPNALMNAEFQRKIRDRPLGDILGFERLTFELLVYRAQQPQIGGVMRKLLKTALWNLPEKLPRISFQFAPEIGVDPGKKRNRLRMPAPPDVVGQFPKKLKFRRNAGAYIIKLYVHTGNLNAGK